MVSSNVILVQTCVLDKQLLADRIQCWSVAIRSRHQDAAEIYFRPSVVPELIDRQMLFAQSALSLSSASAKRSRKTVAAIVTEYAPRWHADVICGRLLEGYYPNCKHQEPRTHIVSMYTDQIAKGDMSRDLATKHRFTLYPTIAEALMRGGDKLAVDAVLLIAEHGDYPTNHRGQKMYPRYEWMEQIVRVFELSGRSVPLFTDKHLSYSWPKAKRMYDWSRELAFPMMAGSSIPVTVRVPELEIPYGAKLRRVVQVSYSETESYGFHALEAMQCMVERRRGGETGVASVEYLAGDAVWRWRNGRGQWSIPLLEAALSRDPKVRRRRPEENCRTPVLFVIEYRDGLHAAVYILNEHSSAWTFAAEMDGSNSPVSTHFGLTEAGRDLPHFDGLVHCIEEFFVGGKPVYPVERTLLTSGMLSSAFDSMQFQRIIETPELDFAYQAPQDTFFQRG